MSEIFNDLGVEISFASEDNFLMIKETLTRIGIASKKENKHPPAGRTNGPYLQCLLVHTSQMRHTHNGFGLGAVERQPVRWENCAKPVLAAGGIIQH